MTAVTPSRPEASPAEFGDSRTLQALLRLTQEGDTEEPVTPWDRLLTLLSAGYEPRPGMIPDHVRQFRLRMLTIAGLLGGATLPVVLALKRLIGSQPDLLVATVISGISLAGVGILHRTQREVLVARSYLLLFIGSMGHVCCCGGMVDEARYLPFLFPLMAFALRPVWEASVWMVLLLLGTGALILAGHLGYVPLALEVRELAFLPGSLMLMGVVVATIALQLDGGQKAVVAALRRDPASGLANRLALHSAVRSREDASLFLLRIENYDAVVSYYGFGPGDELVLQVSERIRNRGITLWEGGRLFRPSPGSIALLCEHTLDTEEAVRFAEALLREVEGTRHRFGDLAVTVSARLGVASGGRMLVQRAERALALARREGERVRMAEPVDVLVTRCEAHLHWTGRLQKALGEGRIVPYFQPIVDLQNGRVVRHECLMRMIDEAGEAVPPGQFLDVARQSALYNELTRTILSQAFTTFRNTEGAFSVNLSTRDMADPRTVALLRDHLARGDLAHSPCVEILESESVERCQQVRNLVRDLQQMSCRVAIDDFGSGYSNFSYLLSLEPDLVKIDGSLVRDLHRDPVARAVVRSLVQLAHELGIQCVAEFVHCREVLAVVRELGVDYGQGYVFSAPRPEPLPSGTRMDEILASARPQPTAADLRRPRYRGSPPPVALSGS